MNSHVCSVKTDMLPSGAISRLYIANANRHDSGNYSCGKCDASSIFICLHNFLLLSKENSARRKAVENFFHFPNLLSLLALGDIAQATVMVHVLIGE